MEPRGPRAAPTPAAAAIRRAREHLDSGRPSDALAALDPRSREPHVRNARAVCLLRLDRPQEAVEELREVVYGEDSLTVDPDQPAGFLVTFAAALLRTDNVQGALRVLAEVDPAGCPPAARIVADIAAWRAGLSLWQRFAFRVYGSAPTPVPLSAPPGEWVEPDPKRPPRAA